jgi:hypothetical protein
MIVLIPMLVAIINVALFVDQEMLPAEERPSVLGKIMKLSAHVQLVWKEILMSLALPLTAALMKTALPTKLATTTTASIHAL